MRKDIQAINEAYDNAVRGNTEIAKDGDVFALPNGKKVVYRTEEYEENDQRKSLLSAAKIILEYSSIDTKKAAESIRYMISKKMIKNDPKSIEKNINSLLLNRGLSDEKLDNLKKEILNLLNTSKNITSFSKNSFSAIPSNTDIDHNINSTNYQSMMGL